jgi:hypothetical protein
LDWTKVLKAAILALLFSFVAFLLTGSELSFALGLLVFYLEVRR